MLQPRLACLILALAGWLSHAEQRTPPGATASGPSRPIPEHRLPGWLLYPSRPADSYCVYARDGWLVWTKFDANPNDKSRAPARRLMFWRQRVGAGHAEFAFELWGVRGRVDVHLVLPDGTMLLVRSAQGCRWVPRDVLTMRGLLPQYVTIDGASCDILAAWADGIVVQPRTADVGPAVYFVPLEGREPATAGKSLFIPGSEAKEQFYDARIFRAGDLLLYDNHLLNIRTGERRLFTPLLEHVCAFDGKTIVGQTNKELNAYSLGGTALLTDDAASACHLALTAAVHDRVGYVVRALRDERRLLVEAFDLSRDAKGDRRLLSKRYSVDDLKRWERSRVRPLVIHADGLHLWTDRWVHVPWLQRRSPSATP
jgi:hypothetical protein